MTQTKQNQATNGKSSKHVLGFDPGLSGGWAYGRKGEVLASGPMPVLGKEINIKSLASEILAWDPNNLIVVIERVASRPGQGAPGMFKFGKGYGTLIGMCQALQLAHDFVRPQDWKKVVLAGTKKDKDAAIDYVSRVHPNVALIPEKCRVPHDGIAEAICIMEWGLSKYG